ncbi:probable prophage LambdaSo, tail assembly protein K [Psychrobacter arcticus 273-4]|uniref:Probable prophage LambdaSo, tail assembly protein K n=1 Tax=Psychrobacter arcticus (strain DSM 17307 / VKM B-2377 / 273-4) TaxID=259536 RepID=Q4FUK0_PSYA2|nr:Mov34/MPN/PAD-1 family protein [Psychrobacter arcticus]AAZ18308.1 probable prophage LambdaSo, tail assembly protein K [Psychrobacter arcticus 273-4]
MYILKDAKDAMLNHAAACYPHECCGLLVNRQYIECENIADNDSEFKINPRDVVRAEKLGKIEAIVHSHPNGSTKPSTFDLIQMQHHNVPWIIVAYPEIDIKVHAVKDYKAPLINREYIHGVLDCFSIVRDYYSRELDIQIDNFERQDKWWESVSNADLYVDNFASQGFVQVDSLQRHDVILCRVQPTEHVNHALIYLGDNGSLTSEQSEKVINDHLVLHHPYMRRSRREIYGNVWQQRKAIIVRHKSLM